MKHHRKSAQQQTSDNRLLFRVLSIVGHIVKSLFFRIYLLPVYALVLAPWVLLTMESSNQTLKDAVFRGIAILSGAPNADVLDENNILLASLSIFVIVDVLFLLLHKLRNQSRDALRLSGQDFKKRFFIQSAVTLAGWCGAAFVFADQGAVFSLLFVFLGVMSCLVFGLEYVIKLALIRPEVRKLLHLR